MSDDKPDLTELDAELHRDKIRNRILLGTVAAIALAVALWVGSLVDDEQTETRQAQKQTVQAQVEKFNLAQQVAAACADQGAASLDEDTYRRLCTDARTIVREGPQGAQGIPGRDGAQGVQGIQGIPGTDGADGADGATGPAGPAGADGTDGAQGPPGPAGADGKDGAVGPAGPAGKDGQPPLSWVVYGTDGQVTETCMRVEDFDPDEPRYNCTRQ